MDSSKVMMYIVFYMAFFAMGLVCGMLLQQVVTQSTLMKVANNLEGVQIDIDLNETKLIEGITDFYTPYFEELMNESKEDISSEEYWYNNGTGRTYDAIVLEDES